MSYELGQRVRMTGTAVKTRSGYQGPMKTTYEESPLPRQHVYRNEYGYYIEGVIVGSRTVQNGRTVSSLGEGPTFIQEPGTARRVWLVAYDLRRKPAMCFDHQIEERA